MAPVFRETPAGQAKRIGLITAASAPATLDVGDDTGERDFVMICRIWNCGARDDMVQDKRTHLGLSPAWQVL
jgi:hypothetical protein